MTLSAREAREAVRAQIADRESMRLARRVLIASLVSLLALFAGQLYSSYLSDFVGAFEVMRERLQIIAREVADEIDGDLHRSVTDQFPRAEDFTSGLETPAYRKIRRILSHARDLHHLETPIYTLIRNEEAGPRAAEFAITSSARPYFRHPYTLPETTAENWGVGGFLDPYRDDYGTWVSAFAPILDGAGRVAAIVQVDQLFDVFLAQARAPFITRAIWQLSLVLSCCALLLVFHFGYARSVRRREARAEQISYRLQRFAAESRSKSRFLGLVAADLENPSRVLLARTQELRQAGLEDFQRISVEALAAAARRIAISVGDLRSALENEHGTSSASAQRFSLLELLERIGQRAERCARQKDLEFTLELPRGPLPPLLGDAAKLESAIAKLVDNSLQTTELGSIRCAATIRSAASERVVLECEIEDTGTGITREQFERWTDTAHASDEPGGSHLPMSLAIARFLIRQLGGELAYHPSAAGGCWFHFAVELEVGTPTEDESSVRRSRARVPVEADDLEGVHVLVAEDDPASLRLISALLRRWGIRFEHAAHGGEAVELFIRGSHDLILMDCLMPGIDGFEATRRIREIEAREPGRGRTPIIAVTASAMAEDRDSCRAAGMDAFLGKPYSAEELRKNITAHVRASSRS